MPVSMAQKKEMKAQLQNATKLRLQGFDQIKWQRRKFWQQLKSKWSEYITKIELWQTSLKTIEGNFGTGVVAYFLFLRWLMFLNLAIFLLIFTFIVLPQILLNEPTDKLCDTNEPNSTECCTESYLTETTPNDLFILDIIQGTGFMEKTLMFYGMYTNKIFGYQPDNVQLSQSMQLINGNYTDGDDVEPLPIEVASTVSANGGELYYDLPLAYVTASAGYFLLSLIAIVKSASREFKERLVEGEGQFYRYCNLVFGGWDFCIHNEKSAHIKHKALHIEIKELLQAKRMEYERHNRSRDVMCKLVAIRIVVNFVVLLTLAIAAIIISVFFNMTLNYFYPNFKSNQLLNNGLPIDVNGTETISASISETSMLLRRRTNSTFEEQMINLLYEFLPYIAIVCMNLLVPLVFNYLVQFERYSPMFVIKITLLRTVFLRLSSLAILLSRFFLLVNPPTGPPMPPASDDGCYNKKWGTPQCWETFVGQQFYKLFIVDFVTHIFVTFFVNFPRALLAKHMQTKLTKFIGEQEFELSKHVLDVVYSQTLCWLGSFYAPFLPAIAVPLNFLMFYVKKFACLVNSKPSPILYRASRSHSLFMLILLLSFVIAIVPVVYAVAEILPSRSCGPFRGLNSVWEAAIIAFLKLPEFSRNTIFFFGTAGFAIPSFVVLTLLLYYYYAVSSANKHMVEVLKNQLVLEGHDKQFLLNRLSSFLKQQQEYQKKMRQAERNHHRERERERSRGERDSE